ncbi:MAG: hypothetical protein AB1779_11655, partial [Candidatus Thermoplasmatota archaeon]
MKVKISLVVIVLLFLPVISNNISGETEPTYWEYETVDERMDSGQWVSMTLDSSDAPHILYYGQRNIYVKTTLSYATKMNGKWSSEYITDYAADHVSIGVNSLNIPYIVFYDSKDNVTKCGWKRIGTSLWSYSIIKSIKGTAEMGENPDMDIDKFDNLHVSYYDKISGELKYAKYSKSNSTWSIEVVVGNEIVASISSIAVDLLGRPHMIYLNKDNILEEKGELKYAVRLENGTWDIDVIDKKVRIGFTQSIATDAKNNVHVSYINFDAGNLNYALKNGDKWNIEEVEPINGTCFTTSIKADSLGNPHISYASSNSLRYAVKKDGSWKTMIVDSRWESDGLFSSLSIDSLDRMHISYYSYSYFTYGDLKYARTTSTPSISHVSLSPSYAEIDINEELEIKAQAYDLNNQTIIEDVSYEWYIYSPGKIEPNFGNRTVFKPAKFGVVDIGVYCTYKGMTKYGYAKIIVIDKEPTKINHEQIKTCYYGWAINIRATIVDEDGIERVELYYRLIKKGEFSLPPYKFYPIEMKEKNAGIYEARIDKNYVTEDIDYIEYFLSVVDSNGCETKIPENAPYTCYEIHLKKRGREIFSKPPERLIYACGIIIIIVILTILLNIAG